jgi:ferredoxin-like protein FixX
MVSICPDAVKISDNTGQLPIHQAAGCLPAAGQDWLCAAVLRLIKTYPESLMERDAPGTLPLHTTVMAWMYGDADHYEDTPWDAYEIITMMVYHCPAAVHVTDNDGKVPLGYLEDYKGDAKDTDATVALLKDPSTGGCKADEDVKSSDEESLGPTTGLRAANCRACTPLLSIAKVKTLLARAAKS